MRILITGAYGFVGTNLCKYLTEKGHECDALDIPAAKRDDVPYAASHSWDEVEVEGGGGERKFDLSSYDAVVHLAGKAHDLKKVASEQSYFDINVGLTQRIFAALRAAKEVEAKGLGQQRNCTFIYFSSSKADANGNAYGRSKLAAEEYLLSAVQPSASNLNLCILRPAMIHGPGNKGNLNLLWGIARRGIPWPLAAFENKRSFTSVGNVCAVVEALCEGKVKVAIVRSTIAEGLRQERRDSTFFVADDEMLSTNRLIELIAEACGRKAKLWRLPKGLMTFAAKIGDICHLPLNTERLGKLTEDSFVDNAALKKALGWDRMPVGAEEGMRLTLRSFR